MGERFLRLASLAAGLPACTHLNPDFGADEAAGSATVTSTTTTSTTKPGATEDSVGSHGEATDDPTQAATSLGTGQSMGSGDVETGDADTGIEPVEDPVACDGLAWALEGTGAVYLADVWVGADVSFMHSPGSGLAMATDPQNGQVWVFDRNQSNLVHKLDPLDLQSVSSFEIGLDGAVADNPVAAAAFDREGRLWVMLAGAASLYRLDPDLNLVNAGAMQGQLAFGSDGDIVHLSGNVLYLPRVGAWQAWSGGSWATLLVDQKNNELTEWGGTTLVADQTDYLHVFYVDTNGPVLELELPHDSADIYPPATPTPRGWSLTATEVRDLAMVWARPTQCLAWSELISG